MAQGNEVRIARCDHIIREVEITGLASRQLAPMVLKWILAEEEYAEVED